MNARRISPSLFPTEAVQTGLPHSFSDISVHGNSETTTVYKSTLLVEVSSRTQAGYWRLTTTILHFSMKSNEVKDSFANSIWPNILHEKMATR